MSEGRVDLEVGKLGKALGLNLGFLSLAIVKRCE